MKNIKALLNARKEVCLEVNAKKTKYMFISHHQTAGHHHNIHKICNTGIFSLHDWQQC
jgi:hypothetical protein